MYKILTLVGTRPEIIKLSETIKLLDNHFNHILVHSGQNYDYTLNKIFFNDLGIRKPDFFLNVRDKQLFGQISKIIKKTDQILKKIKPDALLVYGDTNTSLGIIPAKRNKIPIFHMEAGNRCFDQRVPEEINRKIADHLSDVNITISKQAKSNLLREGLDPQFIFQLGSCMKEVIFKNKSKIENSKILKKLNLKKDQFILISLHREENVDQKDKIISILNQIKKIIYRKKLRIIMSAHPRTRNNLKEFNLNKLLKNKIELEKPFGFFDYCKLQQNSYCVISDSGTIFEEACLLNFPAVTIRASHERPEGIEGGAVAISCEKNKDIINTIAIARKINQTIKKSDEVEDYNKDNVSSKVLNLIESYISIINKKIWFK